MAEKIEGYFEQTYPIECKGRDLFQRETLTKPIRVYVKIYKSPRSNTISSIVEDCPYNCGAHGERCSAFMELNAQKGFCPYSIDLPHTIDKK